MLAACNKHVISIFRADSSVPMQIARKIKFINYLPLWCAHRLNFLRCYQILRWKHKMQSSVVNILKFLAIGAMVARTLWGVDAAFREKATRFQQNKRSPEKSLTPQSFFAACTPTPCLFELCYHGYCVCLYKPCVACLSNFCSSSTAAISSFTLVSESL